MAGGAEGNSAGGNGEQGVKRKPHERRARERKRRMRKCIATRNRAIRPYVQPQNAVICLNKLEPGLVYATEQEGGIGQPFCVSVEVAGLKYKGTGSSKTLAKQAAAEAALTTFVRPLSHPIKSIDAKDEQDETPWATLACFALYKLFSQWKEGHIGYSFCGQSGAVIEEDLMARFREVINAHLLGRPTGDVRYIAGNNRWRPRKIPDNASTMHPVNLLHHLRRVVHYGGFQLMEGGRPICTVTTEIDGIKFAAVGTTFKKAKFYLARQVLKAVYNIDSEFTVAGY